MAEHTSLEAISLPLERDLFLRTLISHLAGALQEVVGLQEAEGFISIVGQRIGDELDRSYRSALQVERLSAEQVGAVCLDLKRRIQGTFTILHADEEKIVFGNTQCPFAEKVHGRPSLCMMTSNVFGAIAAQNLGYAKVSLEETIAKGDAGCRVVLYLRPGEAADSAPGREYFQV